MSAMNTLRASLLVALLALSLAGCSGRSSASASAEGQGDGALGDLDRIIADNPDSASAGDLRSMRESLSQRAPLPRARQERKPFDRRTLQQVPRPDRLMVEDRTYARPFGGKGPHRPLMEESTLVRVD